MGVTISWSLKEPHSSLRKTCEEIWDLICPNLEINGGRGSRSNRKMRRKARNRRSFECKSRFTTNLLSRMRSWIHPYLERRKQEAIVSARWSTYIILAIFLLGATTAAHAQIAPGPVTSQSGTTSSTTSGSGSSGPAAPAMQNSYQGSVPGKLSRSRADSLQNAIDRGLKTNLGLLLSGQDVSDLARRTLEKVKRAANELTTTRAYGAGFASGSGGIWIQF